MMHRAPRLAERSMCGVPRSNYGSVRLGLSVGAHRCQRRGEERSVAGSQAEEPPNHLTSGPGGTMLLLLSLGDHHTDSSGVFVKEF